jgi:hypothetical protein
MFSRHTYLVIGLLIAGGTPYLSSRPAIQDRVSSWMPSKEVADEPGSTFTFASANSDSIVSPPSTNPFGGTTSTSPMANSVATTSTETRAPSNAPPTGSARLVSSTQAAAVSGRAPADTVKTIRFEEVFRLDVNSAWLMARWPRVSTGLAELDLHGYRVSLLTGTREDDLAGALTYYYDKEQVIQKMTFRGVTGDPRRLVLFGTSQYKLERETVSDPALQVYRTKGTGRKASELIVRPAQVIRADAPRERFEVELVLYR